MTQVLLGNVTPLNADGSRADIPGRDDNNTITYVTMREGWDDAEEAARARSTPNDPVLNIVGALVKSDRVLLGVHEINQLWASHSAGDPPEWVESDDKELAKALSEWFSLGGHTCTVGRPDDWDSYELDPDFHPPIGGGAYETEFTPEVFSEEFRARYREHQLLVTAGRDALHSQHLNTAAPPATFNYMCLSANATAPSAANTTLPGEITTAGGGLLRAQATYAHTGGATTTTLTKTFTGNGSDSYPVTIAKIGVLNAASVGTLGYETLLSSTATLTVSGDNITVTHTITMS